MSRNISLHPMRAGGGHPSSQHKGIQDKLDESLLYHLSQLFNKYAGPNDTWSRDQIGVFMQDVQSEDPNGPAGYLLDKENLDLFELIEYLASPCGNALNMRSAEDLSWPLSSYYISSSHNTYLTGNQLSSDSSAETYKEVLLRGCRCIEIDVWDGEKHYKPGHDLHGGVDDGKPSVCHDKPSEKLSWKDRAVIKIGRSIMNKLDPVDPEGRTVDERLSDIIRVEPRVLHGFTLTKEVLFRDVCQVVKEYAFVTSTLPLIVSLEVHCNTVQQGIMVDIMNEIWKDYLLLEPEVEPTALPSPDQLRRKILIKVKYVADGDTETRSTHHGDSKEEINEAVLEAVTQESEPKTTKAPKIISRLSRLSIHTRGISFKSLEQPEASMPNHIFSLSEKVALATQRRMPKALFKHNRDFLMRIYPHGMRFDSSNFDPVIFWRAGVQVVALNWQHWDVGMILNEGMFAGSDGYVLKPKGYRRLQRAASTPKSDTEEQLMRSMIQGKKLDRVAVTVLAAQNLPLLDRSDEPARFVPYVKVRLHTAPDALATGDGDAEWQEQVKHVSHYGQTEKGSGTSPDFGNSVIEFLDVEGVVPEVAFLSFVIMNDGSDTMAAWACVRLDRLKLGYRFVRLLNRDGMLSNGILLIKTEVLEFTRQ